MYRFLLFSFFVFFILSGCKDKKEHTFATGDIRGVTWQLSDIGDKQLTTDIKTTLIFGEDYKISGNTGCNNYFGTYTLMPYAEGFKVSNIGSTRKMCPEEIMERENTYLEVLGKAVSIKFNDNKLEIDSDAKISSIKFIPDKKQ